MTSSTGISIVHRALHVMILLMGMAAGNPAMFNAELEQAHLMDIQEPPECIYRHPGPPNKVPSIMYPLYYSDPHYDNITYACTDDYIKAISKGCSSILAVINPGDGPAAVGSKAYNGYQACTRLMGKNGVQMVGYVKTKVAHKQDDGIWVYDGVREMGMIKRDIDHWYDHFRGIPHFKGIFVDETSNYYEVTTNAYGIDNLAMYREIITYIKTKWKGSTVVLNPGSFTSTLLLTADLDFPYPADISIPWEDFSSHWRPENDNCTAVQKIKDQGNFGVGPWCKYSPKWDHVEEFKEGVSNRTFKAAAFMHSNVKGINFAIDAALTSARWNFTYFYSTNRLIQYNPWIRLPDYWEEYLKFLHDNAFENSEKEDTNRTEPTFSGAADGTANYIPIFIMSLCYILQLIMTCY